MILPTSRKRKRKIQYRKIIQENIVLYLLDYLHQKGDSTLPGTNVVYPLSVPEQESVNSCESNEKGKERNSSENSITVEVEEDPLSPTLEVSHSIEGDLGNYKPKPMDIKFANVSDGGYLQNNEGTHLDGKSEDDKV